MCHTVRHLYTVPQCSAQGPLLFLIYIDDLADVSITEYSTKCDDLFLYHAITSQWDFEILQDDSIPVEGIASLNCLTVKSSKCKYMLVSGKNNHISACLKLNGFCLE